MKTTYKTNHYLISILFFLVFALGQAQNPTITFTPPSDATPTSTGGGLLPLPSVDSPLEIDISFS